MFDQTELPDDDRTLLALIVEKDRRIERQACEASLLTFFERAWRVSIGAEV